MNNFFKNKAWALLSCSTLLLSACGDDASSGVISMTDAVSAVLAGINNVGGLQPDPAKLSVLKSQSFKPFTAYTLETGWDGTTFMNDERTDSGPQISLRDWMGVQLDVDAARTNGSSISVFGRLKTVLAIPCALASVATLGADGYPADGTQTVTLTSAANATLASCGLNEEIPDGVEQTVTIEVSTPADTSIYDKKIVIDLASVSPSDETTGNTQEFYVRATTGEINIASVETYTVVAESLDYVSRTLVGFDRSSGKVSAEYISGADGSGGYLTFQRVFWDDSAKEAAIHSYTAPQSDGNGTYFEIIGKPEQTDSTVALSVKMNPSSGDTITEDSACVNPETGNIVTQNSLECTMTGTSVTDAMAINTDVYTAGYADWVTPDLGTALGFTTSTIFTQEAQ